MDLTAARSELSAWLTALAAPSAVPTAVPLAAPPAMPTAVPLAAPPVPAAAGTERAAPAVPPRPTAADSPRPAGASPGTPAPGPAPGGRIVVGDDRPTAEPGAAADLLRTPATPGSDGPALEARRRGERRPRSSTGRPVVDPGDVPPPGLAVAGSAGDGAVVAGAVVGLAVPAGVPRPASLDQTGGGRAREPWLAPAGDGIALRGPSAAAVGSDPPPTTAVLAAALRPMLPPTGRPEPTRGDDDPVLSRPGAPWAEQRPDLVASSRDGVADVEDLADLLAAVLEDSARALGVLELEP